MLYIEKAYITFTSCIKTYRSLTEEEYETYRKQTITYSYSLENQLRLYIMLRHVNYWCGLEAGG